MRCRGAGLLLAALTAAGCGQTETTSGHDFLSPEDRASVAAGAHRALRVAVVDGGVDAEHPALRGKVVARWRPDGSTPGVSAHATQVAGIIAGAPDGEFPGGLAPGATILDGQALDERGLGRPADVASALRWAVAQDAELIVTSFGTEQDHPEIRAAVSGALAEGVVVVAAAGNGLGDFAFFPAGYDGVVGVTSRDRSGGRSVLANGEGADFAAPGEDIVAPTGDGTYAAVSGTSIAAATAAGLIAACWVPADLVEHAGPGAAPWPGESVDFPRGEIPSLTCPETETE